MVWQPNPEDSVPAGTMRSMHAHIYIRRRLYTHETSARLKRLGQLAPFESTSNLPTLLIFWLRNLSLKLLKDSSNDSAPTMALCGARLFANTLFRRPTFKILQKGIIGCAHSRQAHFGVSWLSFRESGLQAFCMLLRIFSHGVLLIQDAAAEITTRRLYGSGAPLSPPHVHMHVCLCTNLFVSLPFGVVAILQRTAGRAAHKPGTSGRDPSRAFVKPCSSSSGMAS